MVAELSSDPEGIYSAEAGSLVIDRPSTSMTKQNDNATILFRFSYFIMCHSKNVTLHRRLKSTVLGGQQTILQLKLLLATKLSFCITPSHK